MLGSGSDQTTIQGGMLAGPGTVLDTLVNEAEVDLGANPGTLRVQGDYDQTAAGTLGLKVGGTTAGTTYDQFIVSGTATLDGTLALTLLNNFVPKPGEAFSIMDFKASVGAFTNVMGPLSGGTPIFLLKFYKSLPGQAGGGVMAVAATPEPSIPSKLTLQTAGESLSAPYLHPDFDIALLAVRSDRRFGKCHRVHGQRRDSGRNRHRGHPVARRYAATRYRVRLFQIRFPKSQRQRLDPGESWSRNVQCCPANDYPEPEGRRHHCRWRRGCRE